MADTDLKVRDNSWAYKDKVREDAGSDGCWKKMQNAKKDFQAHFLFAMVPLA